MWQKARRRRRARLENTHRRRRLPVGWFRQGAELSQMHERLILLLSGLLNQMPMRVDLTAIYRMKPKRTGGNRTVC